MTSVLFQRSSVILTPAIIQELIKPAVLEDLGQGDMTTDNLPQLQTRGRATLSARQDAIVSGTYVAREVFLMVDPSLEVDVEVSDGESISAGQTLLVVSGQAASILKAERVALNYLQHLCGIATETRRYVDAVGGTQAQVTDTRKTTPGLRLFEKKAVVDGGGSPHRYNLGSAVMVKDNHIQGVGSITTAVSELRKRVSHTATIEVETDTLEQVEEALDAGADIILLDNMTPDMIRQAVERIGDRAVTEASGGVTIDTIRAIAETGVRYISTSRITLGAGVIDIGLDLQ